MYTQHKPSLMVRGCVTLGLGTRLTKALEEILRGQLRPRSGLGVALIDQVSPVSNPIWDHRCAGLPMVGVTYTPYAAAYEKLKSTWVKVTPVAKTKQKHRHIN